MKSLELDTDLLISVNNGQQIKIINQEKNHLAVYLPDWDLVSSSGFRKKINLTALNKLMQRINLKASVYINNRKVFTLGIKQAIGSTNVKLAFYYIKSLLTGK
jgi:hypothetical protein